MRAPLYKAWTYVFNCKLDEMRYTIASLFRSVKISKWPLSLTTCYAPLL